MTSKPVQSRYWVSVLVVIIIFGTLSIPNSAGAESVGVDLSQEELVVESGETVEITGRNVTTPTDFVVKKDGTLIIENSTVRMVGEHHHDNHFDIAGTIRITNSTVVGAEKGQKPVITAWKPDSQIIVENSNLRGSSSFAHSILYSHASGGHVDVTDSQVGGIGVTTTRERNGEKKIMIENVRAREMGIHFTRYSSVNIQDFGKSGGDFGLQTKTLDLSVSKSDIRFKSIISDGNPPSEGLQEITIQNSSVGMVAKSGTLLQLEDSHIRKIKLKHTPSWANETYKNEGLHPGADLNGIVVNQTDLKVYAHRSSIDSFAIAIQGGFTPVEEQIIRNATLGNIKLGEDGVITNTTTQGFQIYKSNNTLRFDGTTIQRLSFVISVNSTIKGNVSIHTPPEEIYTWGGLKELSIRREYPLDIRRTSQGKQVNVSIINKNGEKIWTKSVSNTAEAIRPTILFGKSNYTHQFTLKVEQGNNTSTRPINLTSDTPIRISSSDDPVEENDEDSSWDESDSDSTHHGSSIEVDGQRAYSRVQQAVKNADPHQTVIVHRGRYNESVEISKPIVLRSVPKTPESTVIDAANSGGVVSLRGDGIVVDGFRFVNPKEAYGSVRFLSNNNIVSNSSFGPHDVNFVLGKTSHNNSIFLNEFETPANFFYLGDTTPRFNHWNTTRPRTYWYKGSKYTSKMGNFYPEYEGEDTDGDGIGEIPYRVGPNNVDYFPLVEPPTAYSFTRPNDTGSNQSTQATTGSPETNQGTTEPPETKESTTVSPPTEKTDLTTTSGQQGAGFGIVTVIIALVISLLALRRQQET